MSEIRVAQSWDSIPPTLYDGDEAISTRKLEKDYRDALTTIERLQNKHYHLWQWIPIWLRNQYGEDYPMNKPVEPGIMEGE